MLNGYGSTIIEGAWLTLLLALSSVAVAIFLGLLGAAFRLSPIKWLAMLGEAYATVIRGIPDLVLILLIFYGGQDLVNRVAPMLGYDEYIDINPFVAGVFTMGFIFGAYLSETFRGAFMAIPKGQGEAGAAYGMSGSKVFFRILVPQMIRFAIPGFTTTGWCCQGHRTDLGGRPAGHDVQGQERGGCHAPAVHLLPGGRGALPGADQRIAAGLALPGQTLLGRHQSRRSIRERCHDL